AAAADVPDEARAGRVENQIVLRSGRAVDGGSETDRSAGRQVRVDAQGDVVVVRLAAGGGDRAAVEGGAAAAVAGQVREALAAVADGPREGGQPTAADRKAFLAVDVA